MSKQTIKVRGARVNNLKNIDVDIPLNAITVVTGLSGSGKSSLVFDTIYAEGRRQYMESLSYYARQFLGEFSRPDVDKIEGLCPAIAIDQKIPFRNPRSTLGTITEIYDLLRALFAVIGKSCCPVCGIPIKKFSSEKIADLVYNEILAMSGGDSKILISAIINLKNGDIDIEKTIEEIAKAGFLKIEAGGKIIDAARASVKDFDNLSEFEVVVDSIIATTEETIEKNRIINSIEAAFDISSEGVISASFPFKKEIFSNKNICRSCGIEFPEVSLGTFSFNSPDGACPICTGLGHKMEALPDLVIPNENLTLAEGAIKPWRKIGTGEKQLKILADTYNFSLDKPIKELGKHAVDIILNGEKIRGGFEGVLKDVEKRYRQASSDFLRNELEEYLVERECSECKGKRLNPFALSVFIGSRNIDDFVKMPAERMAELICEAKELGLSAEEQKISEPIIKEIKTKLENLIKLGLGYLSLSRTAASLSGGEMQRARLARQFGTELSGVLYVLDEPTTGLHQRDAQLIIEALKKLKADGNTALVVEHDKTVMRNADFIIDIGPGAGENGGMVAAKGAPKAMEKEKSLTGLYLSGESDIILNSFTRNPKLCKKIIIENAEENNLKKITVEIPKGCFVCISGVSGSGKSTLISDILAKALLKKLYNAKEEPGKHTKIIGAEDIRRVVNVDQSPIGRTPRSNPATYTGAFTIIRDIFVNSEAARLRGMKPGHFSFNVKGGRCEQCQGAGEKKVEMHFLQDIYIKCPSCGGQRYLPEILDIKYKGLNISNVLDLTISKAKEIFCEEERLCGKLEVLEEVGLEYIKLGQSAMTLSGGEAQRIKLAAELSKRSSMETLYILDEPTTGLHFEDVKKLLKLLLKLAEKGSTVIVVEHNIDVLKNADWIIDLGPEGGEKGGEIVARGTPYDISFEPRSITGKFLKEAL